MVHDQNAKRAEWKVEIVEELIRGRGGEVRGVRIRKAGKGKIEILTRPVQKSIPLECVMKDCKERKNGEESNTKGESGTENDGRRPSCDLGCTLEVTFYA